MMKPRFPFRALPALAAAALLAGCASTFDARVSTFHRFAPDTERTYAFAPTAAQRDSLEYRDYEARLRAALAQAGFRETANPALRVAFDWSVSDSVRTVVRSAPVFTPSLSLGYGFGAFGGGFGGLGLGFGYPFGYPYWGPGYVSVPQAERAAEHRLRIEMTGARPPHERVYEASAVGEATAADMPAVLPLLAQALLRDFPGTSGQSRVIRVELPRQ